MPQRNRAIKKRRPNQNDGPPKKQGRSECHESPNALVEMKHFTDINDDCLEHIFKKLPLDDLLNVADSCKRLQNVARWAFISKYGRHTVHIGSVLHPSISIDGKKIWIPNSPACLKVLRCFGNLITKLDYFSILSSKRKRDVLDRYLNEYCAESVVELVYSSKALKDLTKPFRKVESVRLTHVNFRGGPADVNRCFPKLRAFTMQNLSAVEYVLALIPNLERLDILVLSDQRKRLATVLKLNPQLQRLRICGIGLDLEYLRFLSEYPQLESLEIWSMKALTVGSNNDPIHFKYVRQFQTFASNLKALDEANISITFDHLDEFSTSGLEDVDESVIRFGSRNSTISKFMYSHRSGEINEETVLKLAKALPSVKELRIMSTKLSADNLIIFLTKCPLLEYIKCTINDRYEYYELKYMMGAEWRSSINEYDQIELQR